MAFILSSLVIAEKELLLAVMEWNNKLQLNFIAPREVFLGGENVKLKIIFLNT